MAMWEKDLKPRGAGELKDEKGQTICKLTTSAQARKGAPHHLDTQVLGKVTTTVRGPLE